jgi:hypothetical protein
MRLCTWCCDAEERFKRSTASQSWVEPNNGPPQAEVAGTNLHLNSVTVAVKTITTIISPALLLFKSWFHLVMISKGYEEQN